MNSCKTLFRASLSSFPFVPLPNPNSSIPFVSARAFSSLSLLHPNSCIGTARCSVHGAAALSLEESLTEESPKDTVKDLLTMNRDKVPSMMKMDRRCSLSEGRGSWFPYEDRFRFGDLHLSSREVLEAVSPYMMEERIDRFRRVVENRSFSVCLVVEGLSDIGNIAAAFRSADALGIQSVHVVSCDSSKRCL